MQDNITKLFKAIADPTRREIFHALVIATFLPYQLLKSLISLTLQDKV